MGFSYWKEMIALNVHHISKIQVIVYESIEYLEATLLDSVCLVRLLTGSKVSWDSGVSQNTL